ncbi:STT3 domain-containing protein [Maridesulfovibrio hydrothermalis]|uniref:Oligosaccharyl transferase STT3 subunit n=1 Tax=Maridesulfovibrio hydrothermalis AM13 = DSM 14728 TaxID=1121451 RepID=L0R8W0_9BACT|nr:STT3 domain-containing protein [Maridesulfovibrio hydrothermalis]CCO23198.1 conserved membrane protein of unknown function [Maridesulfovibrio hydrothermalis AM13 = DSM 14728]
MRQEFQKPAWMNDWKVFVLFAVISFTFAFGLRCVDLPKWDNPAFMVHGEYIMGTHDAYYWLAGAKGVGSAVDNPMSTLVRFLGGISGFQYGNIAFWLPAVFAGLCAATAFAWGMLVAGPWVGLVSAVYATSIPAFYFRTRLSYYDTDLVTLFFPLLISLLLARWVSLGIRGSWIPQKAGEAGKVGKADFTPTVWDMSLPIIAGCITSYGKLWHSDVLTFGIGASVLAVFLVFVCGTKLTKPFLLRGVFLFSLSAFFGFYGFLAALISLYIFLFVPSLKGNKYYNNAYVYLGLFALILLVSGLGQGLIQVISGKIFAYLKPVASGSLAGSGPKYPGIAQSVIEAQNLSFDVFFANLTGSSFLGWLGFLCFGYALLVSPTLIFIAPFAAVTFAAIYMGGRFSMFGGIALGIGLSFTLRFLLIKYFNHSKYKYYLGGIQAAVIVFLLFSNIFAGYKAAPPTPIMSSAHVKALVESGKVMDKDSTVWTWWDWGYATMYYAGVNSFANGGHHGGQVLYPLGFVYSTPSFLQANQLIKFSAANGNNPAAVWNKMPVDDVLQMLGSFSSIKYEFPKIPKQYIVVSWENIRLAYWILYYGSWNLKTGIGIHPMVQPVATAFSLNPEKGLMLVEGQNPLSLSGYELFKSDMKVSRRFANSVGPNLVYDQTKSEGFLVDEYVYMSMLTQLLVCDPSNPIVSKHFKLVYEGLPQVRIYEVL